MKYVFYTIVYISNLFGQINYSGSLNPSTMIRLSDKSQITLPFRFAELDIRYSMGDVDLITSTAVEYRWNGEEPKLDLREVYIIWYPTWGEAKLGKQIHAWGTVDGNNPTDNLNPYDYYFMFLPGIDRKIGLVSGSVKCYWNDLQLEAVVIPKHEGNRLPFNEPDFPISPSTENIDPRNYLKEVPPGLEVGFNLKTTLRNSDVGFSFFKGRDRSFSLGGYNYESSVPFPEFSYRKTTVIGADFVFFIEDFTVRGEGGYFHTINNYNYDFKNELDAEYVQYALQIEYLTPLDILLSGQIIGSKILILEGLVFEQGFEGGFSTRDVTEDDFQQGMGTPFASFTDFGTMVSSQVNLLDSALELRLNSFIDLEENQLMLGGGVTYSQNQNWKIECSATKFMGEDGTQFQSLEDFSHFMVGLKYSF